MLAENGSRSRIVGFEKFFLHFVDHRQKWRMKRLLTIS